MILEGPHICKVVALTLPFFSMGAIWTPWTQHGGVASATMETWNHLGRIGKIPSDSSGCWSHRHPAFEKVKFPSRTYLMEDNIGISKYLRIWHVHYCNSDLIIIVSIVFAVCFPFFSFSWSPDNPHTVWIHQSWRYWMWLMTTTSRSSPKRLTALRQWIQRLAPIS